MADKSLPGGNLYFTASGEAGTPDASLKLARNREALDLAIRADAEKATRAVTEQATRIRAMEVLSKIEPGSTSDATVASHIAQPDSMTNDALGDVLNDRVTAQVEEPLNALRADLATQYAPVGSPVSGLAPYQAVTGGGFDGGVYPPTVVAETELLRDTEARIVDGAKFFAPLEVGKLPGEWIDQWYGYLAGHDSPTIWLVTAPDLLGPWTWREPVIGLPGSGARMVDATFQGHTSSPEVLVRDGKIHVYYHGPLAANLGEQPTALATSTDGVSFTNQGIVLATEFSDGSSPYRTSTSYVRIARDRGIYHAIWQGTTGYDSVVNGYAYGPAPVGHAVSVDGRNWNKLAPLLPSASGDQGMFAPGLIKTTSGWLVVGTYRRRSGTSQVQSVDLWAGDTLDTLRYVGPIVLPGVDRTQSISSPVLIPHNNRLYLVGGTRLAGESQPVISACELDWR